MRPVVFPAVTADLKSRPEPGVSYDDELQITGPKGFCNDYQRIPVARLIREPHRLRSRLPTRFLLPCFYETAARSAENRFRGGCRACDADVEAADRL